MADAMDGILRTYADTNIREDISSLITILTGTEAYFLNNLGKVDAINTIHTFQTDTLRTVATAAVEEGADFTYADRTTPSKITNLVEFIAIPFKVSDAQRAVEHYSGGDELVRQTEKALKEWADAAEYDLVRSSLISGASGTTPQMQGLLELVSNIVNVSAQTSGTTLAASIIQGMMKDAMDNGNGTMPTDLFVGSYLKVQIDNFTSSNTKYVMANAKQIIDAVNIYETGFGMLQVHYHRRMTLSTDATGYVLLTNPDDLRVAYLIRPYIKTDLAKTGPFEPRVVWGGLTLECRNKYSSVLHTGFNKG